MKIRVEKRRRAYMKVDEKGELIPNELGGITIYKTKTLGNEIPATIVYYHEKEYKKLHY